MKEQRRKKKQDNLFKKEINPEKITDQRYRESV